MWQREISREDKLLFPLSLLGLSLLGMILALRHFFPEWIRSLYCPFLRFTGLYCPGCGGQRALEQLSHGGLFQSLYYHPAVLPLVLYMLIYMLSQSINRLSRGRTKALCFKGWHLYVFAALVLLQWIVKNGLKLAGLYQI